VRLSRRITRSSRLLISTGGFHRGTAMTPPRAHARAEKAITRRPSVSIAVSQTAEMIVLSNRSAL
jgi:hypothetical protein